MLFLCWRSFRASNPSVRARRLRRSPTEGTPLGVSVDSRCMVSLMPAQFVFWCPYAGADPSVRPTPKAAHEAALPPKYSRTGHSKRLFAFIPPNLPPKIKALLPCADHSPISAPAACRAGRVGRSEIKPQAVGERGDDGAPQLRFGDLDVKFAPPRARRGAAPYKNCLTSLYTRYFSRSSAMSVSVMPSTIMQ